MHGFGLWEETHTDKERKSKLEETLIQTLSITVEELLNPIILLFDRLLLPSYALLTDTANSTRCFIVKIIFVWEFKMWIEPCRFTGIRLDLWLVCVGNELLVGMCVCVVPETMSVCNNTHLQLVSCLQGGYNSELSLFNEDFFFQGTGLSFLLLFP